MCTFNVDLLFIAIIINLEVVYTHTYYVHMEDLRNGSILATHVGDKLEQCAVIKSQAYTYIIVLLYTHIPYLLCTLQLLEVWTKTLLLWTAYSLCVYTNVIYYFLVVISLLGWVLSSRGFARATLTLSWYCSSSFTAISSSLSCRAASSSFLHCW